MICSACGNLMSPQARFCSNCGRAAGANPPIPVVSRLVRPRMGRVFGGVCAGFAQHYGWDVDLLRIVLVVLLLVGCGTPLLAYIAAWLVMPNEPWPLPASPSASSDRQPIA